VVGGVGAGAEEGKGNNRRTPLVGTACEDEVEGLIECAGVWHRLPLRVNSQADRRNALKRVGEGRPSGADPKGFVPLRAATIDKPIGMRHRGSA